VNATQHYCHNCLQWATLPDTVHCSWCLKFFSANRRMPFPSDYSPEPSVTERLYERIANAQARA
jgi:hypothetical protein